VINLDIQYIRASEVPTLPEVLKIIAIANKRLQVKTRMDTTVSTYDFDFRLSGTTRKGTIGLSPQGHANILYQYFVSASDLDATLVCPVPANTPLPTPLNQRKEISTFPSNLFIATGETAVAETTHAVPSWIPGALSETEKKERFIHKVKAWREQIKKWLLEAPQYADLVPDIINHLGYWLRAADWVIHQEATKAVAQRYDWLILEAICKEAMLGPRTLDADGDGSYDVVFFRRLKEAATTFPNGPGFGALWVQTWDLTSPADVSRVADFTANVINTHGSTNSFSPDRTYHNLPAAYDPTAEYWSNL